MNKVLRVVLSAPKILWFNLRYLPFKQAVRFPFLISFDTWVNIKGGRIILESKIVKPGMIHLGFHDEPVCNPFDRTTLAVYGDIIFKGKGYFGIGTKFKVMGGATLILGDGANLTGNSAINCYKRIDIGGGGRMSWDILIMDSDTHSIYDKEGDVSNHDKPIIIGDHVWVGCRAMILKGSIIPKNSIVAAGTIVSGQTFEENTVIAGQPPKSVKEIGTW